MIYQAVMGTFVLLFGFLCVLMASWTVVRAPRTGRYMMREGKWPAGERFFWLVDYSKRAELVEIDYSRYFKLYGAFLLFLGWYTRIFLGIVAVVGICAVLIRLTVPSIF